MPRRKATPSKRPLVPPQVDAAKRPKRGKCYPFRRQRPDVLHLSGAEATDAWRDEDTLRLQFPVPSPLTPSLTALCRSEGVQDAVQAHIDLVLMENNQVKLQLHGREDDDAEAVQLPLSELFPYTYEAWKPHVAMLAERGLLQLHIEAQREGEGDDWTFSFSAAVAWRSYMEICNSRSVLPMSAAPKASPMRAMHHVMIWLLKKAHDAQRDAAEAEVVLDFRYWNEVEVLYDRFVGDNTATCALFKEQTFAMPEVYARIDAMQQLSRDTSAFGEAVADLLPTLRAYQKAAVSWMLSREKPQLEQATSLPQFVACSEATAGNLLAYDPFCAVFYAASSANLLQREQLRLLGLDFSAVRGGILADEMGLGKTVEVIALVLSHRRASVTPQLLSTHSPRIGGGNEDVGEDVVACICGSSGNHPMGVVQCEFCGTWHHQLCTGYEVHGGDSGESTGSSLGLWSFGVARPVLDESAGGWSSGGFMCYHCQNHERPSFACRTTLIVSPEPIHAQWENEFSRHVREDSLSVMRYPGVRALRTRLEGTGPSAEWQVLASPGLVMAQYDVVLTTYEALAADLRHVPTEEGGDRRSSTRSQSKRYAFVGSPLVALHFWRICMDEAQVGVENTRLQAALTLSRLSAENRWVVTGTPFSARVSELFGYLRFLRIPPYTSTPFVEDTRAENLQELQSEHKALEAVDLGFFREAVEHNFVRGAIDRVLDLLLWNGSGPDGVVSGGGILWRTGKKHVLGQLGLPPQRSEIVWCHFAAVERHFYDQQEKRIASLVQQRQSPQQRQSAPDNDVIERDDRLWQDLLVLRQLCCHPQVGGARQVWGSGGTSTGKTVMTMDAFLQELLSKATRECEEAQRQLIGAQNGLAALLMLDHDTSGAALKYMAQMSLIRTNWPRFRADLLPRLHILQNLEKCIQQLYSLSEKDANPDNGVVSSETAEAAVNPKKVCMLPELPALERRISSTGLLPGSDNLPVENVAAIGREYALLGHSARHIRQHYLLQVDMTHVQALNKFNEITQLVNEGQQQASRAQPEVLCTSGHWWSDALAIIEKSENSTDPQLVVRVQARLAGFGTRWGTTFCSQLVSTRSLRLLLVRELETLSKRRRTLLDRLAGLSVGAPTDADVELSGNCVKCRDGGTGPTCVHCQLYKELEAYRQHFLGIDKAAGAGKTRITDLFDEDELEDDGADVAANAVGGGVSVSLFLEVFKEISSCARSALRSQVDGRSFAAKIQSDMQRETEFWLILQREWEAAKKLFQAQHQRLGALDELVMACSQLRLRQPGEPPARTKAERLYKLERVEVPVRAAELEAERMAADLDLREKMAQLRYLLQLQSEANPQQRDTTSGSSPLRPLCAVCLQEFTQDSRRGVLPCAHAFCTACIANLTSTNRHTRRNVRCPTCRRVHRVDSVTVVIEGLTPDLETRNQGELIPEMPPPPLSDRSLGSKLDALLKRVDMLRQENPGVKCLLFSQWSQMLELAVQALPRLGVRCFMYGTKRHLPTLLTQFQTCPAACVLALPFKVGANGLNIVEATEVLLVEPLLSTSIEAQAVNRVHRLGQTRRTRVHRFIVQGSVEERIYRLGHRLKASSATGVEQPDDENDDEDEELQRLGVAPGRKEKEKLTMQDLHELLRGSSSAAAPADEQPASARGANTFWGEMVLLNGKPVRRAAAFEFLERRHATQAREETHVGGLSPHTRLFDKPMTLDVAEELLQLSYPSGSSSEEVAERTDPQVLQHHHQRVKEEIRVWKAAS
jgi:E3 ubiquitin-protein ligase SHPRH